MLHLEKKQDRPIMLADLVRRYAGIADSFALSRTIDQTPTQCTACWKKSTRPHTQIILLQPGANVF